jgi:hypothetical protein
MLVAPMVGETTRAAGRQWCSSLHGHVQQAHDGSCLHDGGRDGGMSAWLGRTSRRSVATVVSRVWSWSHRCVVVDPMDACSLVLGSVLPVSLMLGVVLICLWVC